MPVERDIEIGDGVTITLVEWTDPSTGETEIVGLNEAHKDKQGNRCMGWVLFAGTAYAEGMQPAWTVERANPLTLSPSILCRSCGNHGFIREGRWVSA
jgi:hypothetical protein